MTAITTLKNVSKSYRRGREEVAVLEHCSLEIAEKSFVAIMGPSGSGKTTLPLLKMLNQDDGKTIVMVTHDPKAAEFASREIHIDKGQLADLSTRAAS